MGVISASYNVPFPVRFLSLRSESHVHKAKKSEQLKIWADLAKPGGVWLDCRGKQTGGETVCPNNWSLPCQQRSSSVGSWCSSLQIKPSFTNWSDDSGWARGRRVWVWGGGKVPEEPLAFTLPSLVQVVLLVALLACSLVVVILFQVPHRWPAMLLKVLLVLCIRIICLRYCKGSNVQDKSCQMFFFRYYMLRLLYNYMRLWKNILKIYVDYQQNSSNSI